jgi:hypothetical protein
MTSGEMGEAAYAFAEDELAELGEDGVPLDKLYVLLPYIPS